MSENGTLRQLTGWVSFLGRRTGGDAGHVDTLLVIFPCIFGKFRI
jgi:hypothetical protein